MSHGFDDFGSQYGYDGNLYDWWTPKDKQKFKEIQKDVISQYEEFASRDGIKFDASIGIGEDLADISGLAICDEYLKDFQDNNKDFESCNMQWQYKVDTHCNVLGAFKSEVSWNAISERLSLSPKCYRFRHIVNDSLKGSKKAKGVSSSVVEKTIGLKTYTIALV